MQKYYQNKPKFNGIYSRNNWSKVKDGSFIRDLDEYESIGTHWLNFYVNVENVTYFDSFGAEHISKEIRKLTGNKKIIKNTCRIQPDN